MSATLNAPAARKIPLVDLQAEYREIKPEVTAAIEDALGRGDYILGKDVTLFEQEFAAWCGVRDCVGVATGTDALHFALRACGIGAGDEVITAPNSFVASASCITMAGATPVFADVDPRTTPSTPAAVERAITPRTKAIIPVHLYGQMADMPALLEIAENHGLRVIEDACQAHGASLMGRRAGTWGRRGLLQLLSRQEPWRLRRRGALVSRRPELAEAVRMLRNYGQSQKYHHDCLAYNSRLDTVQAAVLRVKLRHLDRWTEPAPGRRGLLRRAPAGAGAARSGESGAGGARLPPLRGAGAGPGRGAQVPERARRGRGTALPGGDPPPEDVRGPEPA